VICERPSGEVMDSGARTLYNSLIAIIAGSSGMRKSLSRLTLAVAGVATVIAAAMWFFREADLQAFVDLFGEGATTFPYEPFTVVLGGLTVVVGLMQREEKEAPAAKDDARDANIRRKLLEWQEQEYTSRLKQTLTDDIRAELSLEYEPQAAQNREWLNRDGLPDDLSADADIATLFYAANEKLLILGAPGTGKTTTAVRLALQLLQEAQRDDQKPIPILFELSRWTTDQPSMREWLAAELSDKFNLEVEQWLRWLDDGFPRILPVLDGFDEVSDDQRDDCAAAIVEFAAPITVSVVVCSRVKEYELLEAQLDLNAVQIRELSEEQIMRYLGRIGDETRGLQQLLSEDPDMLDLAKAPLLLNTLVIATLGEEGISDFAQAQTDDERRRILFTRYINSRFHDKTRRTLASDYFTEAERYQTMFFLWRWFIKRLRNRELSQYEDAQAKHWLRWLAWQMEQHEKMQVFEIEGLQPDWLASEQQIKRYRRFVGLAFGLAVGLAFGLAFGLGTGLLGGLASGLGTGLLGGLASGLGTGPALETIKLAESLRWDWQSARRNLRGKLAFGLAVGLASGLAFGLAFGPAEGLVGGLFGLAVGPAVGLIDVINDSLQPEDLQSKAEPNQGIWRSLRSYLLASAAYGLFGLAVRAGCRAGFRAGFRAGCRAGCRAGFRAGFRAESRGGGSDSTPCSAPYALQAGGCALQLRQVPGLLRAVAAAGARRRQL